MPWSHLPIPIPPPTHVVVGPHTHVTNVTMVVRTNVLLPSGAPHAYLLVPSIDPATGKTLVQRVEVDLMRSRPLQVVQVVGMPPAAPP